MTLIDRAAAFNPVPLLFTGLSYLKDRLNEPSTWGGVVTAIAGGASLSKPFNWLAIAAGVIGILVPGKGARRDDEHR